MPLLEMHKITSISFFVFMTNIRKFKKISIIFKLIQNFNDHNDWFVFYLMGIYFN